MASSTARAIIGEWDAAVNLRLYVVPASHPSGTAQLMLEF
jgi:hypothetical protein